MMNTEPIEINLFISNQLNIKAESLRNPYYRKSLQTIADKVKKFPMPVVSAQDAFCIQGVGSKTLEIVKFIIDQYFMIKSNGNGYGNGNGNSNSNSNSNNSNGIVIPDEFKNYKKPTSVRGILYLISTFGNDLNRIESIMSLLATEKFDELEPFLMIELSDLNNLKVPIGYGKMIIKEIEKYKRYCEFEERNPSLKDPLSEVVNIPIDDLGEIPTDIEGGIPVLSLDDLRLTCNESSFHVAEANYLFSSIKTIHVEKNNIMAIYEMIPDDLLIRFDFNDNKELFGSWCSCPYANHTEDWCSHRVMVFLILDYQKNFSHYFRLSIGNQNFKNISGVNSSYINTSNNDYSYMGSGSLITDTTISAINGSNSINDNSSYNYNNNQYNNSNNNNNNNNNINNTINDNSSYNYNNSPNNINNNIYSNEKYNTNSIINTNYNYNTNNNCNTSNNNYNYNYNANNNNYNYNTNINSNNNYDYNTNSNNNYDYNTNSNNNYNYNTNTNSNYNMNSNINYNMDSNMNSNINYNMNSNMNSNYNYGYSSKNNNKINSNLECIDSYIESSSKIIKSHSHKNPYSINNSLINNKSPTSSKEINKKKSNIKKTNNQINIKPDSNAFKLLCILYEQGIMDKGDLTRDEIKFNCEKYFPNVNSFDGIWRSNIRKLINNHYILKSSDKYSLAQDGFNLVRGSRIGKEEKREEEKEKKGTLFDTPHMKSEKEKQYENLLYDWSDSDEEFTNTMLSTSAIPVGRVKETIYPEKNLVMEELVLIVDNRETKDKDKSELIKGLNAKGVNYECRQLPMADFIFVMKCTLKDDPRKRRFELLADVVIERKAIPDLANSIKDGRYPEQKFQLKKLRRFGIKNIVYLVEGIMEGSYMNDEDYQNAILSTQIYDGFTVQVTDSLTSTVYYLSRIYETISRNYRFLSSLEYSDFLHAGETPLTLRDNFAKQILQIPLMTAQKAHSIIKKYPTPALLMKKYRSCVTINKKTKTKELDKEKQLHLLDDRIYSVKSHKIGPQLSEKFYHLYNSDNYKEVNKSTTTTNKKSNK